MERYCINCIYEREPAVFEPCLSCYSNKKQNFIQKPMTNADKIRHMSDEELAKIIVRARYFDKFCEMVLIGVNPGFCDDDCNKCALDWLKRKAENNG